MFKKRNSLVIKLNKKEKIICEKKRIICRYKEKIKKVSFILFVVNKLLINK